MRTPTCSLTRFRIVDAVPASLWTEVTERLLLKIDSMDTAVRLLEQFYRRFLDIRFSPEKWAAESDAMRTWIREEARVEKA